MLGIEWLEDRVVLSANPVFTTVFGNQSINEGAGISVTANFTDLVEGVGGGSGIGLSPTNFTSLGSFNTTVLGITSVTIDTGNFGGPLPTISWGSPVTSLTGAKVTTSVGGGPSFEIAVFAFSDFELGSGITISTSGSRPLALLSQSSMTIAGTIDVSARTLPAGHSLANFNDQVLAGPGGGNGGMGSNSQSNGSAAPGAPGNSVGTFLFSDPGGGTGGGHGQFDPLNTVGRGGRAERNTNEIKFSAVETTGQPFGNLAVAIQGGSGGATAGSPTAGGGFAGGGGGGGGIELGAVNSVTIAPTGKVLANGGKGATPVLQANAGGGGGGAGGGILIHAHTVNIQANMTNQGTLSAQGGQGGNGVLEGGGGGGGAILIAHSSTGAFIEGPGAVRTVAGGLAGGATGQAGGIGNGINGSSLVISQTPVVETYNYVIDWDDSTPNETGSATVSPVGAIGSLRTGSFSSSSHTYTDDGLYTVSVTINDNNGGSDTETFTVTASNIAPTATFADTNPVDEGDSADVVFSAAFDPGADDTAAGFRYAYDFDNDGTFETGDGSYTGSVTAASAAVPAIYLADGSGSRTVRGRIIDIDGGFTDYTTDITINNVAPTLTISGDSNVDEGVAYTLNLSAFDPGADTITSWTITWGDSTQLVTGNPSSVTHTYMNGGVTHAVSATATDEDGTFTSNTLNVTVNDVVVVPSVGSFLVGSVLNVIGSSTGNNMANISQSNGTITVDASFNTPNPVSFSTSAVTEIVVQMGDGSDIVIASSSITVPMTIHAGGGNDLITTGNGDDVVFGGPGIDVLFGQGGDDVLLGGTGNDDLLGGNGNDVLIGGNGMDMLFGGNGSDLLIGSANEDLLSSGNGDDILIGGSTVYDDYDTLAKQDAIDDIMDIWTSTDGFTTRVGDLNLSGLLQTNSKVFDDDAMDLIIGGAGRDLVFGDNSPVGDGVSDLISLIPLQDELVALT